MGYRPLRQHTGGIGEGLVQCDGELGPIVRLADTHRGAQVHRLDDNGIADGLLHLCGDLFAVQGVFPAGKLHRVQHRHAGVLQRGFHQIFVHTQSGGGNVAGGVGHAQHFQHTHQGAVLHVGAVDGGDHHVKAAYHAAAEFLHRIADHIHTLRPRHQQYAGGVFQAGVHIPVGFDTSQIFAGEKAVVLGQIQRNDLIFLAIHGAKGLDAGDDGYLVLHTVAAKQNGNAGFHNSKTPFYQKLSGRSFSKRTVRGPSAGRLCTKRSPSVRVAATKMRSGSKPAASRPSLSGGACRSPTSTA